MNNSPTGVPVYETETDTHTDTNPSSNTQTPPVSNFCYKYHFLIKLKASNKSRNKPQAILTYKNGSRKR